MSRGVGLLTAFRPWLVRFLQRSCQWPLAFKLCSAWHLPVMSWHFSRGVVFALWNKPHLTGAVLELGRHSCRHRILQNRWRFRGPFILSRSQRIVHSRGLIAISIEAGAVLLMTSLTRLALQLNRPDVATHSNPVMPGGAKTSRRNHDVTSVLCRSSSNEMDLQSMFTMRQFRTTIDLGGFERHTEEGCNHR